MDVNVLSSINKVSLLYFYSFDLVLLNLSLRNAFQSMNKYV